VRADATSTARSGVRRRRSSASKPSGVLTVAVIALLLVASVFSARFGLADEAVAGVNGRLYALSKARIDTGDVPPLATMEALDREMASALALAPRNGFYELAHLRLLRTPRQSAEGVVQENLSAAIASAKRAVVHLPHSPYAWGDYAILADRLHAQGELPGGVAELRRALRASVALGRREPTVAAVVLDIGLANLAVLDAETTASVGRALDLLAGLAPARALEIAAFRGAKSVVCAHPSMRKYQGCARE
jgi:hypothetical protein